MALDDTIAKYEVQILRTGDGATQAQQQLQALDLSAKALDKTLATSSESLRALLASADAKPQVALAQALGNTGKELTNLRQGAMLTTAALRELSAISLLTGGQRLGEFASVAMGASAALRTVRATALLTGVSLGTIVPVLGGVAAAAGAGFLIWNSYENSLKKTAEQAKATASALEEMPRLIEQISGLQSAGIISPDQARKWEAGLGTSQKPGAMGETDAQRKTFATLMHPNASPAYIASITGTPSADSSAQIKKQMEDQGLLTANGVLDPRIAALEKLKAIQASLLTDTLLGFEKERAEAKKTYDDRLAQIQQLAIVAGNRLPGGQLGKMQMAASAAYGTQMEGISSREDAQAAAADKQKMAARDAEIMEQERGRQQETADMIKQFEQQQKIIALSSSESRVKIAENEYSAKIAFDHSLLDQGRIDEATLTEMDNQAMIEKLGMIKKTAIKVKDLEAMEQSAAKAFASGLAQAMVDFADGSKSAEQAFKSFAVSFLEGLAKMILETEALAAIKAIAGLLGNGGTVTTQNMYGSNTGNGSYAMNTASADALGGLHFAGNGIMSVSSPTYFPKFNVVAGEAGREMLTVLARPRFMELGGIEAVVGNAGPHQLAITKAADLAQAGGGGNGGGVGHVVIEIQHSEASEARIVEKSANVSQVRITQNIGQNGKLREAIKHVTK